MPVCFLVTVTVTFVAQNVPQTANCNLQTSPTVSVLSYLQTPPSPLSSSLSTLSVPRAALAQLVSEPSTLPCTLSAQRISARHRSVVVVGGCSHSPRFLHLLLHLHLRSCICFPLACNSLLRDFAYFFVCFFHTFLLHSSRCFVSKDSSHACLTHAPCGRKDKWTDRRRGTQTEVLKGRMDRETDRGTDRQIERQRTREGLAHGGHRQTERLRDRATDREAEGQTDRQIE